MATTAKYQNVPQRDSFEEAGYSQPPPSYQADPVPGDARSEDDNVPDDFKVWHTMCVTTIATFS